MIRFQGMKHIALTVSDTERSAQFYERAFGMRRFGPTKYGGVLVPLVSPGLGDQISLNREGTPGETDRPLGQPGTQGGIDHFGFVVSAGTNLDAVKEKLVSCGATFLRRVDLAKGVPSLFFSDPDGYVFQVTRFPRYTRLYIALLPLINFFRSRRE